MKRKHFLHEFFVTKRQFQCLNFTETTLTIKPHKLYLNSIFTEARFHR